MLALIDTEHLSLAAQAIIWGNWAGACFALVANVSATRWAHRRKLRLFVWFHAIVAGLSAVYIAAYMVLLYTPVSQPDWSRKMRFVSLVVWPIVWAGPAILRTRTRQAALDRAVAATLAKAVELKEAAQ